MTLPAPPPAAAPPPVAAPTPPWTLNGLSGPSAEAKQKVGSPMYCANHNSSDKRKKTQPRKVVCTSCGGTIQTNYVDVAVCPDCSRKEQRCMCCGAAAETDKDPAPAQQPQQQGAAVYCANHSTSAQRRKGPPRNAECTACHVSVQTNYVDFTLCHNCSQKDQRCMCCGVHCGAGSAMTPPMRQASGMLNVFSPRGNSGPFGSPPYSSWQGFPKQPNSIVMQNSALSFSPLPPQSPMPAQVMPGYNMTVPMSPVLTQRLF
jgi:hypothetical protein